MPDNLYERQIANTARAFRDSVARTAPHLRGGDRPPFTVKVTPSVYRDSYVVEQIAQQYERAGHPDLADLVRRRAAQAPAGPDLGMMDEFGA